MSTVIFGTFGMLMTVQRRGYLPQNVEFAAASLKEWDEAL